MTQKAKYVGLTNDAITWTKPAPIIVVYSMITGCFNKVIEGSIFYMPPPYGPNKKFIAREVVQEIVYFGGAVLFTHLELTLIKENNQNVSLGNAFSWVLDPNINNNFDRKTGHYYFNMDNEK